MSSPHLIGVFDSGVGGLTVVREIFRQLPGEQIVYFGDTKHVPYGSRPEEELIGFAENITGFLVNQGADIIIVACNTSASVSMGHLKSKFTKPIIGVVQPGARTAARVTRNKRIGVIATEATVKSGSHATYMALVDPAIEVFAQACPLFVPLVEAGLAETPEAEAIARIYLKPLQEQEIDTLILGCTHYPYLAPALRKILGPKVTLVDPAEETVKEAGEILAALPREELAVAAFSGSHQVCEHSFYVSGEPELFRKVGSAFLPELGEVKKV